MILTTRSRFALWVAVATCQGVVLLAQSPEVSRFGQIRGIVRDTAGAPIPGVEIIVRADDRRASTNEKGQFWIGNLTNGVHVVLARRFGFLPESIRVPLAAADTADPIMILRAHAEELRGIQVTARQPVSAKLEGFEHRRERRNGGQFITREQIDRRGSIATVDLLRAVPGIKMVDSMGVTIAISSRGAKVNMLTRKQVEACVVRVGLDGVIKDPTFSINLIPPRDIHGIEVYAGPASVPPEFNSSAGRNAQCGLIMIWTRSQ